MTDLEELENFRRNKRTPLDMTELNKLEKMLKDAGETVKRYAIDGGAQIVIYRNGKRYWDALITKYSYGHQDGLLEIMGKPVVDEKKDGDRVAGWLTAKDIMERVRKGTGR